MAVTKYTGNNVEVDFDSTSLTCVTGTDFPKTASAIDASCAGLSSMEYKAGKKTATFTANGLDDIEGAMEALLTEGSSGTLDYYKSGNASGMIKESVDAIITSYTQSAAHEGIVAYTVVFQCSGDITTSTIS